MTWYLKEKVQPYRNAQEMEIESTRIKLNETKILLIMCQDQIRDYEAYLPDLMQQNQMIEDKIDAAERMNK